MALKLDDNNFGTEVIESGKLAMVDFWATWCGPCIQLGPTIEALAEDYDGKVIVGKLNVDDNVEVSTKYKIRSLPTILFIKNGEVVDKQVGRVSRQVLEEKIKAHM